MIMSDLKLFKLNQNKVQELENKTFALERSLQTLIEQNMSDIFGISFLETEYSTGKEHGGRIDSLGIDENNCPVIVEYKRAMNENVINQGLFYLDWLMDHKAEFELLVIKKLGQEYADKIEWSMPRLLCIAGDFTKYDEHAVKQINRNIELIRYRKYSDDILLFELVNSHTAEEYADVKGQGQKKGTKQKTFEGNLSKADSALKDLYGAVKDYMISLGDDVQEKQLKFYKAFKRIKNFACIEIHPQQKTVSLYLKGNPDEVELKEGFIRDVRNVGHYGTGDLEVTLTRPEDFEKIKYLIDKSYEMS